MLLRIMKPGDQNPKASSHRSSPGQLGELTARVLSLEAKWKQENEGLIAWLKKWGAIIGLLAGVVALPKAGYDLYNVVVSKPHTTVTRGLPIVLHYDSANEKISFSFHFSVHNDGTGDDTVSGMWATFKAPAESLESVVSFDSTKFSLKEKSEAVSFPFTVGKGLSRDLFCTIESSLEGKSIPTNQGEWMLETTIERRKKDPTLSLSYRFWLASSDIAELKKSGIELKFLNAQ